MRQLPISGEYSADWDAIGDRVRAEAGHRCIRCGHPYEVGKHGKGQWSPCDQRCTHSGPFGARWLGEWFPVDDNGGEPAGVVLKRVHPLYAEWRILTVHHFDGNKANNAWWNLLALCQRCHLQIQSRVNPEQPYMFEHSAWLRPYVAGFYAKKYQNRDLTREQVAAELETLLALERIA